MNSLCFINVYDKVDVFDKINHIIDIVAESKRRRF